MLSILKYIPNLWLNMNAQSWELFSSWAYMFIFWAQLSIEVECWAKIDYILRKHNQFLCIHAQNSGHACSSAMLTIIINLSIDTKFLCMNK